MSTGTATPEPRSGSARERLLDAASELFYRHGIRAVGIDTVIERAGVAKMSLYNHFRSKDELVVAYLERREQRWSEFFDTELRAVGGAPGDRVLAVFDILASWLERECPRGCAFVNAEAELADPQHPAQAVIEADKARLRGWLAELVAETGAADSGPLAEQIFLLLEGALVTTGTGRVRDPVGVARQAAARLLA
ncbi:transcriptional regulator, TetR family [Actinopolyspora xinjiangensis]|uniref:Transcriptional regulator, TetR family n=1 Tax=Actinopolyspora xinjiangensis TaxID=405564 RepID=A0A1H0RV69_9ACTN|nr:TetR/AcrR family transcriptional regulator [Actinopolyspora xinjiangensis]SDP32876.1 transcriptional regulator, TetR family [Actinopolyspora xinjiangensis]